MRTIKKPTPANDSVNPSSIKAVSAEQIRAVIKFLPILESINPEDLARVAALRCCALFDLIGKLLIWFERSLSPAAS